MLTLLLATNLACSSPDPSVDSTDTLADSNSVNHDSGDSDTGEGDSDPDPRDVDDDGDGWTENEGDCDDAPGSQEANNVYPGANGWECSLYPDGIDNNCDGLIDNLSPQPFYADADGDRWGDFQNTVDDCYMPSGYVEDGTDCDDTSSAVNPAQQEMCNRIDDNCDGTVDEGTQITDAGSVYPLETYDGWNEGYCIDHDGDGYGEPTTATASCETIFYGYDTSDDLDGDGVGDHWSVVNNCEDCYDYDSALHGGPTRWHPDSDGDGYGDAASYVTACEQPAGYVEDGTDASDRDPTTH